MLRGLLPSDPSVGRRKAVKLPAGVRRPMVSVVSAAPSVNQRLPSGPLVMPNASQPSLATQTPNPELGEAARGGNAPNLVRRFGEPKTAILPDRDAESRARGDIELGDGPCCSPGGSCAQAQQTDTGDQGGEKCDQARPPSRTIHASSSLVSDGKRPTGNES